MHKILERLNFKPVSQILPKSLYSKVTPMCTSRLQIFGPNLTVSLFIIVIKSLKYSLVVTHVRSKRKFLEKLPIDETESFEIMPLTVHSHFLKDIICQSLKYPGVLEYLIWIFVTYALFPMTLHKNGMFSYTLKCF